MDTYNIVAAELPDVINLVSELFHYTKEEKISRDFPLLYSPKNIHNLFVMREGAAIQAHAGFFLTKLKIEGVKIPVAGIGGVCTLPEVQGKGYASQLVETCLSHAKKQGAALAFLWTDKHDFYRKQGFELVGRQWCIELASSLLPKLTEQVEDFSLSLSYRDTISMDFLKQSYHLQKALPLGVDRDPEEHALLLNSAGCKVFSAWEDKELRAYMVLNKGQDLLGYIHEWGGDDKALLWLLQELMTRNVGAQFLLSPQFMQEEVEWIYTLDSLGFPMSAQVMGMAKILHLELVQELIDVYLARLGLAAGTLSVSAVGGGGAEFQVQWKNWKRVMGERELVTFLFGSEPPQDLPEFQAILPMRLWYWGMDSI